MTSKAKQIQADMAQDLIVNYIQDLTEDHAFAVLRELEARFGWPERNPDTEVGIS